MEDPSATRTFHLARPRLERNYYKPASLRELYKAAMYCGLDITCLWLVRGESSTAMMGEHFSWHGQCCGITTVASVHKHKLAEHRCQQPSKCSGGGGGQFASWCDSSSVLCLQCLQVTGASVGACRSRVTLARTGCKKELQKVLTDHAPSQLPSALFYGLETTYGP